MDTQTQTAVFFTHQCSDFHLLVTTITKKTFSHTGKNIFIVPFQLFIPVIPTISLENIVIITINLINQVRARKQDILLQAINIAG